MSDATVTSVEIFYVVPKGQESSFKIGKARVYGGDLLTAFVIEGLKRWVAGNKEVLVKIVGMEDFACLLAL